MSFSLSPLSVRLPFLFDVFSQFSLAFGPMTCITWRYFLNDPPVATSRLDVGQQGPCFLPLFPIQAFFNSCLIFLPLRNGVFSLLNWYRTLYAFSRSELLATYSF